MTEAAYRLVQLANGATSVHDTHSRETFHPVVGPVAEAKTLYVEQLRLRERMAACNREFVLWDIGLGAAANALTALRETQDIPCPVRIESFDRTTAALAFALEHRAALGYFSGYETAVQSLTKELFHEFKDDGRAVRWTVHLGDIPTRLSALKNRRAEHCSAGTNERAFAERCSALHSASATPLAPLPAPDAILFDPCSLIRNPEMWTGSLFTDLFAHLDSARPCSLSTYSRSTMIRVTLLLAGFYVGVGRGVGEKEETTIAANTLELIDEPLGGTWLARALKSGAAEPMWEPVHRQAPLSDDTRERLQAHPQFQRLPA